MTARESRTFVSAALAAVLALLAPAASATERPEQDDGAATGDGTVSAYEGDPEAEAVLVSREDTRVTDLDLVAAGDLAPELDRTQPYRVATEPVSTLVLTPREEPYTLSEIQSAAPVAVSDLGEGVYRLHEHLAVLAGASLTVADGVRELQLASQPEGFVSIVTLGGTLAVQGEADEPTLIRSWDAPRESHDANTSDGRAYVRAIGGQLSMVDVRLESLGFWSGNTGGLALTGTDHAFGVGVGTSAADDEGAAGGGDEAGTQGWGSASAADGAQSSAGADGSGGTTDDDGEQPSGISTVNGDETIQQPSASDSVPLGVTARLQRIAVEGNAFGVFVSNASSVEIIDSEVTKSLVDGIVFHREVLQSRVARTTSVENAVDGFRVSRGSNGVQLDEVTAASNGRNGVTIDAGPLADGPSAVGLPVESYGDHTIRDSTFRNNGDVGVEVLSGQDIVLEGNAVSGGRFGMVLREGTQGIRVTSSVVEATEMHGIVVRDGSTALLSSNEVNDALTGLYVRDAVAEVSSNRVSGASSHGVTVVGASEGTQVLDNVVGGEGGTPIDVARADGDIRVGGNDASAWAERSFGESLRANLLSPLSLLWLSLGALLVFTALMGIRHRREPSMPYGDRTPLAAFTGGPVDPATVDGVVHPPAERPNERTESGLPSRRSRAEGRHV
ncbi:right-handed parallel beta-helix repeat-containing protein [Demequina sp. SO4-13]|uniref:right-handed parallel beta-helix repeat-containing protein n=1 Tax=Demequina sp. SO4-13 TaxID=3401027 RepID=UPI003AF6BFB4